MTALQTVCLLAVAVAGTATVLTRDPLRQAVVVGLLRADALAVLFLAFGAPDVALSQIVVAGVAVPVMVLLALAKIRTATAPRHATTRGAMSRAGAPRARARVARRRSARLLVWAVAGLPDFGHPRGPYADLAPRIMLDERHVANAVTGITFDLRGFDTLGEELILFVAALGAAVLLRALADRGRDRGGGRGTRSGAGRARPTPCARSAPCSSARCSLLGIYVVAHGALTPGGGFQGGVLLAGALLLVYAAGQVAALERRAAGRRSSRSADAARRGRVHAGRARAASCSASR